jgi:hypothetical protein
MNNYGGVTCKRVSRLSSYQKLDSTARTKGPLEKLHYDLPVTFKSGKKGK